MLEATGERLWRIEGRTDVSGALNTFITNAPNGSTVRLRSGGTYRVDKSVRIRGKSGLVLIMHASEMAQGNYWQKRIAKLAVERLGRLVTPIVARPT